jgi:molecular chaperone GrpE
MTDPSESKGTHTGGEAPLDELGALGRRAALPPEAAEHDTPEIRGAEPVGPAEPDHALLRLGSEVAAIRALLEERLRYDATKEEAFRRLYEDLEQFRGESSFVQTRPLYLDLVLLLDRLDASVEPWRERSPEAADFLVSLAEEVEEILARRGVLPLPACGGAFNPAQHRVVQVEETDDPEEHNSIARVVRRGYEWNDRLLRAEEVVVRRLPDRRRAG